MKDPNGNELNLGDEVIFPGEIIGFMSDLGTILIESLQSGYIIEVTPNEIWKEPLGTNSRKKTL